MAEADAPIYPAPSPPTYQTLNVQQVACMLAEAGVPDSPELAQRVTDFINGRILSEWDLMQREVENYRDLSIADIAQQRAVSEGLRKELAREQRTATEAADLLERVQGQRSELQEKLRQAFLRIDELAELLTDPDALAERDQLAAGDDRG